VDNALVDVQVDMYQHYINIDHAENLSIPTNKTITRGKQAVKKESQSTGLNMICHKNALLSKSKFLFYKQTTCAEI
jgi:hypothetical protein